jgi:hypothetical protein
MNWYGYRLQFGRMSGYFQYPVFGRISGKSNPVPVFGRIPNIKKGQIIRCISVKYRYRYWYLKNQIHLLLTRLHKWEEPAPICNKLKSIKTCNLKSKKYAQFFCLNVGYRYMGTRYRYRVTLKWVVFFKFWNFEVWKVLFCFILDRHLLQTI